MTKLTPRAKEVLDYLQTKGDATPREALLDMDINSGSFTRRITELRDAGYGITDAVCFHPVTGRRYKRYSYSVDDTPKRLPHDRLRALLWPLWRDPLRDGPRLPDRFGAASRGWR